MSKLLYIQGSPRAGRSKSIAVAEAFVASYRQANPDDEIDTLNVFKESLPAFDGLAVHAKYTVLHGASPAGEEMEAWRNIEAVIERFKAADKYVLATPMWNFGIPYRLKLLIDILVQPGYTFTAKEDGSYTGLVLDKPLFVAYARGGQYPVGTEFEAFDMQKKYIELIFGFMGFGDIRSLVLEPTLAATPEIIKQKLESAIAEAEKMAKQF